MGLSRQNRQQAQAPDQEQQPPALNQKALYQAVIRNKKQDQQRLGGVPLIPRDLHVLITEMRIHALITAVSTAVQHPLHPLQIHAQHKISRIIQQAGRNVAEEIMDNALITHTPAHVHIIIITIQRDSLLSSAR